MYIPTQVYKNNVVEVQGDGLPSTFGSRAGDKGLLDSSTSSMRVPGFVHRQVRISHGFGDAPGNGEV